MEAGLAFADRDQIYCPAAMRLQLPAAPGEDPRSARAIYSRLTDDVLRVLHHGALRGRAGGPRPLGLGELLERIEDPIDLAREVEHLPMGERLALAAIEARGGEVSRDGFLELTRDPARYGNGPGLPLRGTAQSLIASGLVVPVTHDRYVLPTEVARIVGRERREVLAKKQAEVRARIDAREEDTLRARLATDPGPLAIALLVELSATAELTRPDRAVPRSALARAAKDLHVEPERADVLVTLARSLPLRSVRMRDVGPKMLETYRASGLGDETRMFPGKPSRKLGATGIVAMRELALDTLATLPRGRFVPLTEVLAAAQNDLRAEGIGQGLRELARLAPADVSPSLDRALEAILKVSLPALGVVDVSHDGSLRLASRSISTPVPAPTSPRPPSPPRWNEHRATFDGDTLVVHALALAPVARAAIDPELVLVLDPSRAQPLAVDREVLAAALRDASCPPSIIESTLDALPAARAVVFATDVVRWVPIDDPVLRERLLGDPTIARDVVPNGPENGLLVHAHGTFPRLVRLFARHGIDLRKPT